MICAFSQTLNNQLSTANYSVKHLFTGQQWYSNVGVYDLRNRFYSPDTGRFLQADPIGFKGDATNLYRYTGNNPIMNSDPFGTEPGEPFKSALAAGADAARFINPVSIRQNWEYGGLIYKQNGNYYATTARTDKLPNTVDPWGKTIPKNAQEVGWYHAHANYSVWDETGKVIATGDRKRDSFNSDHFSGLKSGTDDVGVTYEHGAGKSEYIAVLATPSGKIRYLESKKGRYKEKTLKKENVSHRGPAYGTGDLASMSLQEYNWTVAGGRALMGYSPAQGAEATNYSANGYMLGSGVFGMGIEVPAQTDFAWGSWNPDAEYPTGPVGSAWWGNHSW